MNRLAALSQPKKVEEEEPVQIVVVKKKPTSKPPINPNSTKPNKKRSKQNNPQKLNRKRSTSGNGRNTASESSLNDYERLLKHRENRTAQKQQAVITTTVAVID